MQVVTCTLGEEGEVIGDRWARLTVEHADQLGGYRIGELSAALAALGALPPLFLGGAGRWRDSGMAGTPVRRQQRFIDADETETVGALVAIIRRLRPHVVVSYDPQGGYGHPDHVHAHTITTAAVAAAAGTDESGPPWTTPKLYWTVPAISAVAAGLDALGTADLQPHWTVLRDQQVPGGYPDPRIDAVIDADDVLPAKVAALSAHATQVSVGPTGRAAALSNDVAWPILGCEHYVLAAGTAGPRDRRGWETDLLAGLDLTDGADR